jgi:hypothetical protein
MSTTYRRRRLSEPEREQRRNTERERVKKAAEQLLTSEGWQRWVRARSMFRRYSALIWGACVQVTQARAVFVGDMSSAAQDTGLGPFRDHGSAAPACDSCPPTTMWVVAKR